MSIVNKKVTLQLVGLNGNAYSLMGAFQRQARKEKWTQEEIDLVLNECRNGDYNHLLCTLMNHCQSPDENEHEEEEDCCEECGEVECICNWNRVGNNFLCNDKD